MAATNKGVWDVQEVRDKQLASEWPYLGGPSERTALYTWGENGEGKLGNNTNQGVLDAYSSPIQIPGTTWSTTLGKTAYTGQNFVMLKTDNELWAWGENERGA